jgi:hypothetical protein
VRCAASRCVSPASSLAHYVRLKEARGAALGQRRRSSEGRHWLGGGGAGAEPGVGGAWGGVDPKEDPAEGGRRLSSSWRRCVVLCLLSLLFGNFGRGDDPASAGGGRVRRRWHGFLVALFC